MSIEISPIKRVFRYNGIALPDVPGLEPREVRDLYSAQYPELVSAEVEAGEVRNGEQEFTFRKAVGVKGAERRRGQRLAALRRRVQDEVEGRCGSDNRFDEALARPSVLACSRAWSLFANTTTRHPDARDGTVLCASDMLAPLP
ncbi:MAG: PRTRC system protein C [Burkholderiaceae bacterium]|nr:PRTRC system protein C [Burkholderiaceae bacterium]